MNITKSRRSIRIPEYEYYKEGKYFITLCAYNRKCIFGHVADETMRLNNLGKRVELIWNDIPNYFLGLKMDAYVIMPNHMHGMISIEDVYSSTHTIGTIVRVFKGNVTRWARQNTVIRDVWQRNYYEHVVRDERDYLRIAQYIETNPIKWELDALHPKNDLQHPLLVENP